MELSKPVVRPILGISRGRHDGVGFCDPAASSIDICGAVEDSASYLSCQERIPNECLAQQDGMVQLSGRTADNAEALTL